MAKISCLVPTCLKETELLGAPVVPILNLHFILPNSNFFYLTLEDNDLCCTLYSRGKTTLLFDNSLSVVTAAFIDSLLHLFGTSFASVSNDPCFSHGIQIPVTLALL